MVTTTTVTLGTIVKAVGRKGEVKLLPGADFWVEALQAETLSIITEGGGHRSVHVDGYRSKGKTFILKLSGFETIDDAEAVVGGTLDVSFDRLDESAKPKQPMPFQLIGLAVHLTDGTPVGEVVDMLFGPAQDCLIVERGEDRLLVPYTPEVVVRLDIEGDGLVIDPPDGLLDLRW